jgi:hypothetical protein
MPGKRADLIQRVLEDSFDPFKPSHTAALREDELPAEPPPTDGTHPLLRDRWSRLLELQREYRSDRDERLRRVVAREFRDVVHEVAQARREPDTLYEFVSSVIGPHPRSANGKRRGGGRRFARFCSEFLVHTKGRWAGQQLVLERHQVAEANAVFAVDPRSGLRLIQEAYVQEPKKNGKSTRASAVAGYLLCADDEPGPEVYGGATDKDQAGSCSGSWRRCWRRVGCVRSSDLQGRDRGAVGRRLLQGDRRGRDLGRGRQHERRRHRRAAPPREAGPVRHAEPVG